jgi:hypothetical protein
MATGFTAMMGLGIVSTLGWVVVLGFLALFWGLLTHATLMVTGGCSYSLGRTCSSILYSGGTLAICAIPCLGYNCLIYFAFIWWVVSATLMVMAAQRVSGLRASLATIWPPCTLVIVFILAYASLVLGVGAGTVATGPMNVAIAANAPGARPALTNLANSLLGARHSHRPGTPSALPESLFDLDWGRGVPSLEFAELVTGNQMLEVEVVPGKDGFDFSELSGRPLDRALKQLKASSVRGDGFERVGALVYCLPGFYGVPDGAATADLWLVAFVEFQGSLSNNMGFPLTLYVVTLDGTTMSFPPTQSLLLAEDANRAEHGLPSISEAIDAAIELVSD